MSDKQRDFDYSITTSLKDVDLARILRENYDSGEEFVSVRIGDKFIIFFTKKFANRVKRFSELELHELMEDEMYGFHSLFSTGKSSIRGSLIRSIGFTQALAAQGDADAFAAILDELKMVAQKSEKKECNAADKVRVLVNAGH